MKLLNVLSVGLLVLFVTTSSACVDDSTDEATTASSPSLWSMLVDTPVDAVAEKLHPQPTRRLRKRKEANQPEDRELAEEGKEALASEDRLHFLGRLLMQSGNAGNAGGFGLGHGGGIFNGQGPFGKPRDRSGVGGGKEKDRAGVGGGKEKDRAGVGGNGMQNAVGQGGTGRRGRPNNRRSGP